MTVLVLVVYVAVLVPIWRRATWLLLQEAAGNGPDPVDTVMTMALGFIAALFWPVGLPGWVLYKLLRDRGGFAKPPRAEELRERERRVALPSGASGEDSPVRPPPDSPVRPPRISESGRIASSGRTSSTTRDVVCEPLDR